MKNSKKFIGVAFVLIAAVMIILLNPARRPWRMVRPGNAFSGLIAGVVAMIPNMFPVVLVFGAMGHLGNLVDIGTMMTASVAMGVAVDDTIHFLSWFRSYLDKGYDRVRAVEMTYRRVGPAMTQTTIVGGLGLFVFALSTFTPTQRFGTLMLLLLGAALAGDLILLPALLAGPLGRFFKPREGALLLTSEQLTDPSLTGPNQPTPQSEMDSPDEEPDEEFVNETDDADGVLTIHPAKSGDSVDVIDKDSLPQLRLHSPSSGKDRSRRMKGR